MATPTFNKLTTVTSSSELTAFMLLDCISIGGIRLSDIFFERATGERRIQADIDPAVIRGAAPAAALVHPALGPNVVIEFAGGIVPTGPGVDAAPAANPYYATANAAAVAVAGAVNKFGFNSFDITSVLKSLDANAAPRYTVPPTITGGGESDTISYRGIEFKVEGGAKPFVGGSALQFSDFGKESHIVTGYDKSISAAGSLGNGLHPSRGGGGCGIAAPQMGGTHMPYRGGRRKTKKGKKRGSAKKMMKW